MTPAVRSNFQLLESVTVASFFTWFFWIPAMSYFVIKAVDRLKAEDAAATRETV